jgi:hypothetical protein
MYAHPTIAIARSRPLGDAFWSHTSVWAWPPRSRKEETENICIISCRA